MGYGLALAGVYVLGTLLLYLSKYKRYLKIIFLIRTKHFIKIIDAISRISPRLWTLLTDISLTLFFGGVGFAYLSKNNSQNSLRRVFAVIGLLTALSFYYNMIMLLVVVAALAVGLPSLKKRNTLADYISGSILITALTINIPSALLGMLGLSLGVPAVYLLAIASIEGLFGVLPILFFLFIIQAYDIVFMGSQQPGVSPAVPDVREGELGLSFPGTTVFIPIAYALIAFITALVCHEFAHGIIARAHDLKLKSTGLLTLGALPIGAFVEPDEEELKKRPSLQKMQIYIAGSFSNLLVSLIAGMVFLSIYLNSPIVYSVLEPQGMQVVGYGVNSTIEGLIDKGEIIQSIGDMPVKYTSQFQEVFTLLEPGTNTTVITDKESYNVTLGANPENKSKAYMGVAVVQYNQILEFITQSLFWIWFINFNLCFVNLLPIVPFDGWRILQELAVSFRVKQQDAMNIVKGVVAFSLLLLLLNALPLFTKAIGFLMEILNSI